VHGVTARVIEGWYRDKGRELGIADGRTGSITTTTLPLIHAAYTHRPERVQRSMVARDFR